MIGYPISREQLEANIEAARPGWIERARQRTEIFRGLGHYKEESSIWSEVKPVYMTLQGESKCAYCERKLESIELGTGEQDVEHFRPKGRVKAWKIPQSLKDQGITAAEAPTVEHGYYLLPYHLFNYAAACKPCNSGLKRDYFPIAGAYALTGEEPLALVNENPYLIYPLGDFDEAPETLIKFHGVSPQPVEDDGPKRVRALVTIEFFKLDDAAKRKNLIRERAAIIVTLYPQLELVAAGAGPESLAQRLVNGFTSVLMAHTNCARSFKALFERDKTEAKAVFERAAELVASIS